ncbi:bifunctional glycosyltransferase/class I SAM-dependent methyltransferase [Pelomonas cellulosilytica]|uniref:Bifunctional glycosyltransferase/class I SAM-dependent methyltransferase n=1 Tax=Pelomonas cellulosilytica TaxID=2906762 RepID=A0ABS8XZQ5_9BURK|nr:bifunctional glycosyltransferase/class I SAM-dependent methyltransferase [Pelomonas sp. P8]MCE4556101.1 bifunctional glycosyltransferase/class I SAM-dependent methyltransferase [Pelomonas sp. P8]
MDAREIPVVVVSYNSPELIRNLLTSLRRFYPNPVHVVDGSGAEHVDAIRAVVALFDGVALHVQGHNIHHGPGMAWAIQNLPLGPVALFLDSDIVVLRNGFIEAMLAALQPQDYGVGGVAYVNRQGFDIPYAYGAVPYLHPPCMLCNIGVMKQWPMPIKHGAPMVAPMLALHDAGKSGLLRHLDWTLNDVTPGLSRVYVDHVGRGTVINTKGYHLEEWMATVQAGQAAGATAAADVPGPAEPRGYNPFVLALIPPQVRRVVEVGCSTGGLALALKSRQPGVHVTGLELDPKAAEVARHRCDEVLQMNVDDAGADFFASLQGHDCWVFGDVLEHLRDPWRVLAEVAKVLAPGGCVVASIPNAQHWSVQARLNMGAFQYEATGLMDRTHIRWFTRQTMLQLFAGAGLRVEAGVPCMVEEPPMRDQALAGVRQMALALGRDADEAMRDAMPLQYAMRAVHAGG